MGEHFNPEEEVLGALQVSFTHLEEWFFHRAFTLAKNADESVSQTAVFKKYPIPVVTVASLDAVVDFDYNTVISDPGFREMRWTTELFVQVTPREKQKIFDYYRGHIKTLQYLMTLLTGLPTFPRAIHFKWDDSSGPIQMFYADRNAKERDKTDFTQMMTLFPRIKEHWSTILNNWFASAEKLHSSMVLLFETMFKPTNVEMDFLRYAQALESFHRAQGGASYMPVADYKAKVYDIVAKSIPSDLDDSLKASLRSKLKYGNEYSLRKRLQQLIAALPPEVLALIKFKQFDEKIGEIVDNRNYLTHYSDELAAKKSEPLELWELGKAMEVILVYYLFRQAGIPSTILHDSFIQKYHTWFNQPG